MVAEQFYVINKDFSGCSLAKISMVAEPELFPIVLEACCSLAKISMVAEPQNI